MLGAEIDFIILEFDNVSNIAIGSRLDVMELRPKIEIQNLKENDCIRVRIIAVGIKNIIVDMYGKEIVIKVDNLKLNILIL